MRRILFLITCLTAALLTPLTAQAESTANLRVLYLSEDRYYNYDFTEQTVSSTKVDWGISLMFWNNAEVDKIKNTLNSPYNASGGAKYARVNDSTGWSFDGDGGRKTLKCPIYEQSAKHYRLYAPSQWDNFYTTSHGYYVLGSTHIDWAECSTNAYFGNSETAEDDVAYQASRHGWAIAKDYANFYNYEAFRQEGNHGWNSDGKATYIRVP